MGVVIGFFEVIYFLASKITLLIMLTHTILQIVSVNLFDVYLAITGYFFRMLPVAFSITFLTENNFFSKPVRVSGTESYFWQSNVIGI